MDSQEELGLQFKKAREKKKFTQADVAKQSDMTVTYYAMIERGEVNPSLDKINKLLKVLGLELVIKNK